MNLCNILWSSFSFEELSIKELIDISSFIDNGKNNSEFLVGSDEDAAQIASLIIALINEESTTDVGNMLYAKVNELIVSKNLCIANAKDGKKLYEKLMHKKPVGKYVIRRHTEGYSFALKSPSDEFLIASELYSRIETCLNGINALKKNSDGEVEDQTIESSKKVHNPKYEVYSDKNGKFRFRIRAKNGEILAMSAGYNDKQACLIAIEDVRQNANSNDTEKA